MIGLLLRYFYQSGGRSLAPVMLAFTIIAIASMIAGNILALRQNNVKRILAYSSIAHLGYVLAAFVAGGESGAEAVTFYMVAYFVTTLGAFGVIAVLSAGARDADELSDYRGLFWRRPALAGVMTAMLLSLAGIPLTAGFIGKFYIVAAGASAAMWALIVTLAVTSAVGLYYYLRILVALYSPPEEGVAAGPAAGPGSVAVLTALSALLVWLGAYPWPMLAAVRAAVSSLAGVGRV
jgi:NADH-quinone oxidoreductase subunit N